MTKTEVDLRQDARTMERRMIRQTMNMLFDLVKDKFKDFPNNRIAIDVETTGTRFHNWNANLKHFDGDLITELGYCFVQDGKVQHYDTLVLDWTQVPSVSVDALAARMAATKRNMETDRFGQPTGKTYRMSIERMQKEGINPLDALNTFLDVVLTARDNKNFFVAHNGAHFDGRLFEDHFNFWCKPEKKFAFEPNEIFDTGMVLKAAQSNQLPWPGDDLKKWSLRVYNQRLKGVKWSLDRYGVPLFKLDEKYNLNMDEAHGAGFDTFVTDCLFRELIAVARGELEDR